MRRELMPSEWFVAQLAVLTIQIGDMAPGLLPVMTVAVMGTDALTPGHLFSSCSDSMNSRTSDAEVYRGGFLWML